MSFNRYLLFSFFFCIHLHSWSNAKTDSLLQLISTTPANDTAQLNLYWQLGMEQADDSDHENALKTFGKVISLAEKFNRPTKIIDAKNRIALVYIYKDEYDKAIDVLNGTYVASQNIGYEKGKGQSLRFRALIYLYEGDHEKATDYYLKAQKIWEQVKDEKMIAIGYSDLGINFYYRNNFKKAIEYWEMALEADLRMNNTEGILNDYSNLSAAHIDLKNYDMAEEYINRSLAMNRSLGKQANIATNYNNFAKLYEAKGNRKMAISFMLKSIEIRESLGEKSKLAGAYLNLCEIYRKNDELAKALEYGNKGLELVEKTLNAQEILHGYLNVAIIYESLGNYEKAYLYRNKYWTLQDSMLDIENTKQINELEKKYESDKKAQENLLLSQKVQLQDSEAKQQRLISTISVVGVIVMIAIAFFLFKRNKERKKANKELEEKNRIIEEQKHLVEEKNKEILDSINYAQKIQTAIMPAAKEFENAIGNCFVLLKPKDIVSGDFYWLSEKGDYVFYATADCTGHGVPGGFMSMLGSSLLNEIVNEKRVYEPADILDLLRVKIILALKQKGHSGENKDGMDMVICRINKSKTELCYAAANNPLWLVRDGKCIEYPADKQPVGISGGELSQFTQHTIQLRPNDAVYTFTDGYADQFGGEKGKKFKYKMQKELLEKNYNQPVELQKILLNETIQNWMGNLEQVDDMLLIGIKV